MGFGTTEFHVFRPSERITGPYLFNLLRAPYVRKAGATKMQGAAGQRRVPADFFAALQVPLPPLAEQKRIAGILDAADALRAKRREALAELDTLLQSTFLDMFGDPVTNPMGWEERTLGELARNSFRNGLSPSTQGTIDGEVLTLSAITRGRFDFAARKRARFDKQPSPLQKLSTDTFLICRGNGNRQLVGIGVYPDRSSSRICFPDTMIGVAVGLDIIAPAYLQSVWCTSRVRRQIERGARTTNGIHKVNQGLLSSIVFPVPPADLQLHFTAVAESVGQQEARHRAHLAELDTLFASLQSRAFSGDL
ncbi:restriction endonuclease subunit S [Candidatus Palauibacter sp.]|uniref:restriction endonuclease subunit S n=1 Tax=Candidatus Palauibacter sp. TaxID=3101350 RepID=UPI003B5A7C0D